MSFDLKSLTLQKMLAQRVMPRLEGARLADKEYMKDVTALVEAGVGGFIIFGGDFWEVRRALARLQAKAPIPLLIASDMERGAGQQLAGATSFPSQMAVAAAIDPASGGGLSLLSDMLEGVSAEARAAGVHAVFSPVMDVNSNPKNPIICTRAFSDDPHKAAALGERYIGGLQGSPHPVMACAKHFPGHGDTVQDSHSVLPIVDKDRESLEEQDLLPFRRAVMADVGMVMTAHVMVPALDPLFPASLSAVMTRKYLRTRYNFEGLVVTDALDMGALAGRYNAREAAKLAIKAGADILLHPKDPAGFLAGLRELGEKRLVTKEEAFSCAGRLQRAKQKYCQAPGLTDRQAAALLHRNSLTAESVADRAVTLVKTAGGFPSLADAGGDIAHIVLEDDGDLRAGKELRHALAGRFQGLYNLFVTRTDAGKMKAEALKRAKESRLLLVSVFSRVSAGKGSSGLSPELVELGRQLVSKNRRNVVISFGSPYILREFHDAGHLVATYDPGEAMQAAAFRALSGDTVFMGKLPVRIEL